MDWNPLTVHRGQGRLGGTGFLTEDGMEVWVWKFGFGIGGCIANSFDAHICQGGVEVEEAGV